ncbi:MAG: alkaline phosphatase family protein [Verrucomicrobium sp.]|nr:alkaline phosphatase family protein [Verrucomicrobium sp.]
MKRALFLLLSAALPALAAAETKPAPAPASAPRHVVVIVWDGLRPDLVTEGTTPRLHKLAMEGAVFPDHHAVYPTSTEVNGAALFTGDEPDHTGILANKEYRASLNAAMPVRTEALSTVRHGDEATGNRYLGAPTLPELLQREGYTTAVAATKPVALLADRAGRDAASPFPVLFQGATLPEALLPHIVAAFGAFPAQIAHPNAAQDAWTTRVLTEGLWKSGVPDFSLLWLSEPDYSQHQSWPGSSVAEHALRSDDDCLGRVLDALQKQGVAEQTDVIVVSDHGFSTVNRTVDLSGALNGSGFEAVREFAAAPRKGQILVDSLGGSAFLYVVGHDAALIQRLVTFLQKSDFTGVLFTRAGLPGTFPLETVRLNSPGNADLPDVVVSFRWSADLNRSEIPGLLVADTGRNVAEGSHSSLSRFDLHNTLIARGPDFKPRYVDTLPTGNIDLAPTLASLFRLRQAPPMDGRVLAEALAVPPADVPVPKLEQSKLTASAPMGRGIWSQYLVLKKAGTSIYLDEGNGESR